MNATSEHGFRPVALGADETGYYRLAFGPHLKPAYIARHSGARANAARCLREAAECRREGHLANAWIFARLGRVWLRMAGPLV